jgi:hypothetical protein
MLHTNHPKYHAEPKQLEFAWPNHGEPQQSHGGCVLSTMVCDHIANASRLCHSLDASHHGTLKSYILDQCSFSFPAASWNRWHDYLQGVASTMSFMPTPPEETFVRSDRVAMASDWMVVQRDLNHVWQAITCAERHCHERSKEQSERGRENQAA